MSRFDARSQREIENYGGKDIGTHIPLESEFY